MSAVANAIVKVEPTQIFQLAKSLYDQYKDMKGNEVTCDKLFEKVNTVTGLIDQLKANQIINDNLYQAALSQLEKHLGKCDEMIKEINKMKEGKLQAIKDVMKAYVNAGSNKKHIQELTDEFDGKITILNIALAVKHFEHFKEVLAGNDSAIDNLNVIRDVVQIMSRMVYQGNEEIKQLSVLIPNTLEALKQAEINGREALEQQVVAATQQVKQLKTINYSDVGKQFTVKKDFIDITSQQKEKFTEDEAKRRGAENKLLIERMNAVLEKISGVTDAKNANINVNTIGEKHEIEGNHIRVNANAEINSSVQALISGIINRPPSSYSSSSSSSSTTTMSPQYNASRNKDSSSSSSSLSVSSAATVATSDGDRGATPGPDDDPRLQVNNIGTQNNVGRDQYNYITQQFSANSAEEQQRYDKAVVHWKDRVLAECQQNLRLYIPGTGDDVPDCPNPKPLLEKINAFLEDPHNNLLLLLGESGCGKSLFGQYLECQLWNDNKCKYKPLWVSLPNMTDPKQNVVEQALTEKGLTEEQIKLLKQGKEPMLFILDAYDEIRGDSNLYQSNHLNQWNAKIIITCRREYLYQYKEGYAKLFKPSEQQSFLEYHVATFTSANRSLFKWLCRMRETGLEGRALFTRNRPFTRLKKPGD